MIVAYALRMVVFPFLLGLAFAYVLLPAVTWLERRMPRSMKKGSGGRISSIAIIHMIAIALGGLFLFYTVSAVAHAVDLLAQNSSDYFAIAQDTLKRWTQDLRALVPESIRSRMDGYVESMSTTLIANGNHYISNLINTLPANLGVVLGLTAVPYFLFYLLKDHERLGRGLYAGLPVWAATHTKSMLSILEESFGTYVRSSFTLGLAIGTLNMIGFLAIRAPLAPLLAIVAGVCEMIPMVGGWLGGIIAVVVTLALAPEKALMVLLIVVAAQLLENLVLAPRIQAAYFHIHPALTIVLLVVGTYLAGIWGVILAMPLASAAIGIYRYSIDYQTVLHEPYFAAETHDMAKTV